MQTEPKFILDYDIMIWMNSGISSSLSNFKNIKRKKTEFKLTEELYSLVEDNLNVFGNTPSGRSQVIKVVPESKLWRRARKIS